MNRLSIISDSVDGAGCIGSQLAGVFEVQVLRLLGISDGEPEGFTVVDINLTDASNFSDLRLWLKRRPARGRVIFAVDKGSRLQAAQAYAIGATDILLRPIDSKVLLAKLLGDIGFLLGDQSGFSSAGSDGVAAAVGALQSIFASASLGAPLDPETIETAAGMVVSAIGEKGLAHWLDIVRKHHSQTYQHCLIVTGVATAFGRNLRFSDADQKRMAFAGLLHDIGKAGVPVAILEKPGPLDQDEITVMRRHPLLGFEALQGLQGSHPEMLDMVAHHHEYLDGSGYPHGLRASELSDLVRVVTIADIYGALIERRAYKPALSGEASYQTLLDMGGQLDTDFVRAFRPLSRVQFA